MASGTTYIDWHGDLEGLSVTEGAMIMVTAEGSDHAKYDTVAGLLLRIRRVLGLDVTFVSLFIDGQPQVRCPEQDTEGECDPLEEAFGRRLLGCGDGMRQVLALPVTGREGWVYGTVCCNVHGDDGAWGNRSQRDALESVASLLASALDEALEPLTCGFGALSPGMPPAAPEFAFAA